MPVKRSPRLRKRRQLERKAASVLGSDEEEEQIKPMTRKKQKLSQLTSFVSSFSKGTVEKEKGDEIRDEIRDEKQTDLVKAETIIPDSNNDQWVDKYAPSLSTVALHKKKLADVRDAFEDMLRRDTGVKLLVLSGPSGCSKSTVVKLLANELIQSNALGKPYIEWFNPPEQTILQFQEFLSDAQYRTGKNLSVILIEELPNVFHTETRESFQRCLLDWITNTRPLPPLVLVITEYDIANDENSNMNYSLDNNYTAEMILGRRVINHPSVKRIKFNPVNATLIKKTLKNIVLCEKSTFQEIPAVEVTAKITELSTFGDIRSSISAFQFWSQWRVIDSDLTITMGKESIMSIFHAIGKCIYGTKQEEPENVTLMRVNQDYLNRSEMLRLGLLENYTKYNKSHYSVLEASRISDSYSLADTLGVESTALEIATRATRDTLREVPLTTTGGAQSESGFNFPREWKVRRAILKCSSEVGKYIEIEMKWRSLTRSFQDSNLLYGYYEPLINRQREFRNKSRLHYLKSINGVIPDELQEPHHHPFIKERLGGPLMEISVDSRMVSDIGPEGNDYSLPTTDDSYFKMYAALAQDDESDSASEFDDDPIVDSDEPDDLTFEDDPSFENALMNFSQKRLQPTASSLSQGKNAEFFNDFNDDDFSE